MALPVTPVDRPAILDGKRNGELPESILDETPGEAGGPEVRLVTPAMRSWKAMCAAAPMSLSATSVADSYRPLSVQRNVFLDRYTKTRPQGVDPSDYVIYQGDRWYKKPGEATAAVPGTSNHGWGLAIDIAGASGDRLEWLRQNAQRFGFSWEL